MQCKQAVLNVSTFPIIYSMDRSFIHSELKNAAATISGEHKLHIKYKEKGKIDESYKFIAFEEIGGTYDKDSNIIWSTPSPPHLWREAMTCLCML